MESLKRYWNSSSEGKMVLGLGGMIALLFPCAVCLIIFALALPSPSPVPAVSLSPTSQVSQQAPVPEPTSTPKPPPSPTLSPATAPAEPSPTATQVVPPTAPSTPLPGSPPTAIPEGSGLVEAQVIKVVDGDTIDVLIDGAQYRVRYILVDTPETKHPERGVEPFGPEAFEANRALVEGKPVLLEKDVSETDRYGRLLRYVYVDELMVNEELLRLGLAQVATFPPDVKYVERFLQVQAEARAAGVGLWGATATEPTALPPPVAASDQVIISRIFSDGVVSRVESDEYAEITNTGQTPVEIGGWRLNAGDEGQDFIFPNFALQPGQACRIYTNEIHPESCGFSFGSGRAIWNNQGDCGYLYDAGGALIARKCY